MNVDRIVDALRADAALSTMYSKGLALARDRMVSKVEETTGTFGSTVSLSGRVKGSYGNDYHTEVQIDIETGDLLDYYCECPAALNYSGLCKHEIALVLSYLGNHNLGPVAAASRVFSATGGSRLARISYTSPAIRGLLENLTATPHERARRGARSAPKRRHRC